MGYFGVQLRLELLIRPGGQQAVLGAAALATQGKLKLDRRAHGVTTAGRALLLEGFIKKLFQLLIQMRICCLKLYTCRQQG